MSSTFQCDNHHTQPNFRQFNSPATLIPSTHKTTLVNCHQSLLHQRIQIYRCLHKKKTSKDSARQDNTLPFENDHKVIEQNQPLTIIKSGRIIKPKQYSDTLYYWHQAFNSIFLIHTFNFNFSLILTNTLFTCFTDLGQKKTYND